VIRVANAPCSWGALEFESAGQPAPAPQVLDEMAAAGYTGTELGDWGFLPTAPAALGGRQPRQLALVAPSCRRWPARTRSKTAARAVRTARLLNDAVAREPLLVLADDNAASNRTTRAGRIRDEDGEPASGTTSRGARNTREVRDAANCAPCSTIIAAATSKPREDRGAALRTDPALLGLCPTPVI
jgi:inosose dehydratase